ncbi:hypothetical protein HHI36_015672 [Cryptolaemus montrouzieri]|uniref:Uncharacterized protein n=1 Tax=Cryptolaemus montrouzieri TaxID=559131 RepID=A0ABD2N6J4_9CUCU
MADSFENEQYFKIAETYGTSAVRNRLLGNTNVRFSIKTRYFLQRNNTITPRIHSVANGQKQQVFPTSLPLSHPPPPRLFPPMCEHHQRKDSGKTRAKVSKDHRRADTPSRRPIRSPDGVCRPPPLLCSVNPFDPDPVLD